MGTLTERALKAIDGGEYITPQDCLEYLNMPQNFNNISYELKRLMESCGFGQNTDEYEAILTQKMAEINDADREAEDEKENPQSLKQRVQKWLSENAIPKNREDRIKICFALGFDENQSKDFLRKGCRDTYFNFRNAEEVVYFYCILTKQPFSKARMLIKQYNETQVEDKNKEQYQSTQALRQVFEGMTFESDEEFMRDLCKNKMNFNSGSNSIMSNYRAYRNSLCRKIIRNYLNNHAPEIQKSHAKPEEYQNKNYQWKKRLDEVEFKCPVCSKTSYVIDNPLCDWQCMYCDSIVQSNNSLLQRISSALKTLAKNDSDFTELHRQFDEKDFGYLKNDVWEKALKAIKAKELNTYDILMTIVSDYMLLREILVGVPYVMKSAKKDPEKKHFEALPYSESILGEDLLKDAPKRQYLKEFNSFYAENNSDAEKNNLNGEKNNSNSKKKAVVPSMRSRKLLVLLFFVDYLLEWLWSENPVGKGYDDFHAGLTKLLDECGLPFLYPADPFDWHILNTIRYAQSENEDDLSMRDPINLFNEVISLSFEKPEAQEEDE